VSAGVIRLNRVIKTALGVLGPGDTLVVVRLDRSLRDLANVAHEIELYRAVVVLVQHNTQSRESECPATPHKRSEGCFRTTYQSAPSRQPVFGFGVGPTRRSFAGIFRPPPLIPYRI
jgi:hypothetical protein